MMWLLLPVMLALSFALSGLESAIIAVSRVRVRHAAREGDERAARLLPLIEDRDALLGAITVTNHVTNLIAFLIIAWNLVSVSETWGYLIAFILGLPIFLIGLEVLPKKLFRRYPFRAIRAVTPLVVAVGIVRPLFRTLTPGLRQARNTPTEVSSVRADLRLQATTLEKEGHLSASAARLIHRLLDYHKLRVGDVMRPLTRSVALAADVPLRTAIILAREHDCTTLPVLDEKGQFVGVLDVAALPPGPAEDRLVRQHMRSLVSVPQHESALRVLQSLRKQGRSLALVLNDKQEPAGLAHEEDLLRHLMGTQA